MQTLSFTFHLTILPFIFTLTTSCDLELLFNERRVSLEESAARFPFVFRGLSLPMQGSTPNSIGSDGSFTVHFQLLNTFKVSSSFRDHLSGSADSRQVNVTIMEKLTANCEAGITIPEEYIVFAEAHQGKLFACSVAKWNENSDHRLWKSVGWSEWSEWSSCSESCSSGIQQRVRRCLNFECPGHNVEQRHCNLFRCNLMINPLAIQDDNFFHPSKDQWRSVPDRPSAWRMEPFTYLWIPSVLLLTELNVTEFPKQFSIVFTVRLYDKAGGTIFSLRSRTAQNTYLAIDLREMDLKLTHAAQNSSDTVIIPMDLRSNRWHQIAISIRNDGIIDLYLDCRWMVTNVLKSTILDLPEDTDLIVGYLFSGDLEQVSVITDPTLANSQCSSSRTPIIDPSLEIT